MRGQFFRCFMQCVQRGAGEFKLPCRFQRNASALLFFNAFQADNLAFIQNGLPVIRFHFLKAVQQRLYACRAVRGSCVSGAADLRTGAVCRSLRADPAEFSCSVPMRHESRGLHPLAKTSAS